MELFIPCIPKPKGRPRFTRKGHAYTPQATRDAENEIASYVRLNVNGSPLEGALRVDLEIMLPVPTSWGDKKYGQAVTCQIWPTVRGDLDNYGKLVGDALNGILWKDDSQIVQMSLTKRYSDVTGYNLRVSRPVYSRVIPLTRINTCET